MKVTRENLGMHLIEYQLNMIGKTVADVESDEQWYHNNTFTQKQFLEFKAYAIPLIKKVLKCNSKRAITSFEWLNLGFGLRVVPTKEEHENIISNLSSD
jgi:hypothetical protein